MSIDMNLVIFAGRLTKDPKALGNNKGCRIDVASNRKYKNKEGIIQEESTFMPVTCWGYLGVTVLNNCKKGDSVIVQGRLEIREFKDNEDKDRKFINIVASEVRFVNIRPSREQEDTTPLLHGLPPGISPDTAKLVKELVDRKED